MGERMKSRIHLEGGESVPVDVTVADVMEHLVTVGPRSFTLFESTDGPAMVMVARIVWVSTLQGGRR